MNKTEFYKLRHNGDSALYKITLKLQTLSNDIEEYELLNKVYPNDFDQKISLLYSRYKHYNSLLKEILDRMVQDGS